jgi:hypothetical protein
MASCFVAHVVLAHVLFGSSFSPFREMWAYNSLNTSPAGGNFLVVYFLLPVIHMMATPGERSKAAKLTGGHYYCQA